MSDGTEPRWYELTQNRRRALVTGTAYGAFVLVMGAVEALAVRGQLDFGRHVLGLVGGWLAVVPVALEAGALTWAALALWQTLTRDSGTAARAVTRLGTMVAVAAAAAANWLGAEAAGRSLAAAGYLAGASVMALAMWHVILHGVRHAELRAAGAIEPPLPRFRALRWLVSPRETAQAYALAVRECVTSPAEAIALVRQREQRAVEVEAPERTAIEAPAATTAPTQSRNNASAQTRKPRARKAGGRRGGKSDALRAIFDELGQADVPRALQMLADRGIAMDRSAAYGVARKWSPTETPLRFGVAASDTDSYRLEESA